MKTAQTTSKPTMRPDVEMFSCILAISTLATGTLCKTRPMTRPRSIVSMPLEVQPKSCTSVKTASIHSSRSRPKCGAPQAQIASTAPSNGDGQAPSPVRRGAEDFPPIRIECFSQPIPRGCDGECGTSSLVWTPFLMQRGWLQLAGHSENPQAICPRATMR